MPQELTTTMKNQLLDSTFAPASVYVSAHTASPGLTGANEVSGGAPAYARKLLTYAAASGGTKATSATVTLDIPAATTVAFIGLFDAVSAGNFLAQDDITDEVFGSQGTLDVTAATLDLNNDPA